MPQKYRKLFSGQEKTSTHLLILWILSHLIVQVNSFSLLNSKAVLQGCTDQWTLKARQPVPQLPQMTVCIDIRLMTPGKWMAFSYTVPRSPNYSLALQGDGNTVIAWLLGVQHRFPMQLALKSWHRLCLRIDSLHNSFSLSVNSSQETQDRAVFAYAMQPNGRLQLGCQFWDLFPGTNMATIELYMFRMWGDVRDHAQCENGTIAGWDSSMWRIIRATSLVQDDTLSCSVLSLLDHVRKKRSNNGNETTIATSTTSPNTSFTNTPTTTSTTTTNTPTITSTTTTNTPLTTTSTTATNTPHSQAPHDHKHHYHKHPHDHKHHYHKHPTFTSTPRPQAPLQQTPLRPQAPLPQTPPRPQPNTTLSVTSTPDNTTQPNTTLNFKSTSTPDNTTQPNTILNVTHTMLTPDNTTQPNTTLNVTNTTLASDNTTQPNANRNVTDTTLSPDNTSQPNTTLNVKLTTSTPDNTLAPNTPTSQEGNSSITTTSSTTSSSTTTSITTSKSSNGTSLAATTTPPNPQSVVDQILNQTQGASTLNSSQVQNVVNQLEGILSAPNISLNVFKNALSTINNLQDAPQGALASSSNRLIKIVDELALKLIIPDKSVTITLSSLALAVTNIDGANFAGMSFSINGPSGIQMNSRRRRSVASSSTKSSINLPASLTDGLSPEQKQQASRLQFTFYQKSSFFQDKYTKQQLNSLILGTSVANLSIRDLKENVQFSLMNTSAIEGNLTCVFWDFNQNGGAGGWNKSGCFLLNSTDTEMKCSCNHLTSFAVLMDISRGGITDKLQDTILTFITYIGCGISAIFLAITLLTYLAFDKIRRDIPSKILIQLCLALFLLNMVFLVDAWLALYTEAVGLCISTAFFLHYFLLASFTWMGLESLHLYLSIVKVFKNFVSHYMLKFSLAGWGIPLIVVIIVISVDKNNYGLVTYGKYTNGTGDFCWLNNDIAYYVSVVAYFCVIFVVNMIMFVVVMVQLRRIKRQNPQNNQYRKGLQDLRSIAGLVVLLGLTWGFAFFAWGPVNLAFMYLFTIFNSFQGLFIFVFHCAVKESVRRQWRTYLCCGRFRLAENSDWSRVATQHNKKSSVITTNISNSSRNSSMSNGSSGLASNFNNSPVDDSGFSSSEDSNNLVRRAQN
ncbi:adhesion G-protein coupled receptor G2 [Silurus meridionalis]|uniref:adhesion G-protein coupled receptor G2 n=1 Tax=Silurus meridionalis TaxID=175797 RepID=UPI001EEBC29E|nr:adhesion G-protein coupled receptor G2 [Silurus meridionalis]